MNTTADLATPQRPLHLSEIVSENDVGRMLAASATIRNRLLIGLLYGCGLKVGETCRLRWADVDVASRGLTVHFAGNTRQRRVELPNALLPVLEAGRARCAPDTYIFAGAKGEHTHLSARMAQRIVRRAALEAAIEKPVCCMTMRHSYAVAMRRQGAPVRNVQENLGHQCVKTTLRYDLYTPPAGAVSPVDRPAFATTEPPPCAAAQSSPRATPAEQGLHEADNLKPLTTSEEPSPLVPQVSTFIPQPADLIPPPSTPTPTLPLVTLEGLSVPFGHLGDGAREFYALLKTRIRDRFLALRVAVLKSG